MNQVKIVGKKNEAFELYLPTHLNLNKDRNEFSEIKIEIQIKSGLWASSRCPQFVEAEKLITFLKDIKSLIELKKDSATLQTESDILFIRAALRSDKKEIWIYGHIKELDHKHEFKFSFESDLMLMKPVLNQIEHLDSLQ